MLQLIDHVGQELGRLHREAVRQEHLLVGALGEQAAQPHAPPLLLQGRQDDVPPLALLHDGRWPDVQPEN